jgi:hypothetical protein
VAALGKMRRWGEMAAADRGEVEAQARRRRARLLPDCGREIGKEERKRKENKRNDGTHVWRGNGGPAGMEGGSGNLEEYGK